MKVLEIETPEGVDLRHEVAGAGARSAAALLDLGLFAVGMGLLLLATFLFFVVDPSGVPGFVFGLAGGGVLLGFVAYHTVLPITTGGSTIGKQALGLRVVDVDGNPARAWQHLLRAFFLPLETFLTLPVSLGILVMVVSRHDQRLGDLVAGTLVVRDLRSPVGGEPYPRESWSELRMRRLELTPALAARFGNEDLALLRELLARRGLDPDAREALLLDAGRRFARRLGQEPPGRASEAQELLRELFLYLREARGPETLTPPRDA